jgi:5-methylcytosine-specific restriction enzyme subunit McrC
MEAVFEAFVAAHLPCQLPRPLMLKSQVRSEYLVAHRQQRWFRLKPDLLVQDAHKTRMVLDTKWKLLDAALDNATDKYGVSEADFYQMHAYGHSYLQGVGELALVYPLTDTFKQPMEFSFLHTPGLRLWVLPFCLKQRRLHPPPDALMPRGNS